MWARILGNYYLYSILNTPLLDIIYHYKVGLRHQHTHVPEANTHQHTHLLEGNIYINTCMCWE